MTAFAWTVPEGVRTSPIAAAVEATRTIIGEDLAWNGGLIVAANRDWATVAGREALRQSTLRRLATPPGSWVMRPDYGVGVEEFLYEELTPSRRDELISRIKTDLPRDPRIDAVSAVEIGERDAGMNLRIRIHSIGELVAFAFALPEELP